MVYLRPPKKANSGGLWKLKKMVYGLKDAAMAWCKGVVSIILDLGGLESRLHPTVLCWKEKRGLKRVIDVFTSGCFFLGKEC